MRADIVDDRHAQFVQFARQAQVEVGKVDQHRRVGTAPLGLAHDLAKAAVDGGNVFDDLDDADFGDLARVDQQVATGAAHLLSAHPEELDAAIWRAARDLPAQGFHQFCAIEFARSFSGGDQNSHLAIMTGASEQL